MNYDPIYDLTSSVFHSHSYMWLLLALASAIFSMKLDRFLLGNSNPQKKHCTSYEKDLIGRVYWHWLVLAPVVAIYFIVAEIGVSINKGLSDIGFKYQEFSLNVFSDPRVFWLILFISAYLTIDLVRRYMREKKPSWLARFPVVHGRAILINFPMTLMAILTITRLVDHWFVLIRFAQFDWRPVQFMHLDGFYGIAWSQNAILIETVLVLALGLTPLIVRMREQKTKFAKNYTLLFRVSLVVFIGAFVFALIPSYDRLYEGINDFWLQKSVTQYNDLLLQNTQEPQGAFRELVLSDRIATIRDHPAGISKLVSNFVSIAFVLEAIPILLDINKIKRFMSKSPLFMGLLAKPKQKR